MKSIFKSVFGKQFKSSRRTTTSIKLHQNVNNLCGKINGKKRDERTTKVVVERVFKNETSVSEIINTTTITTNRTLNWQPDMTHTQYFMINNVSILKIDEEIRYKLASLKHGALEFNANVPAHISMLETLYDIKLNSLKRDASLLLQQAQYEANSNKSSPNGMQKLLQATSKLLKSGLHRQSQTRQRARSVDQSRSQFELIEKEYEKKIREMQFDILRSLNDIEIQMSLMRTRKMQEDTMSSKHQDEFCCQECAERDSRKSRKKQSGRSNSSDTRSIRSNVLEVSQNTLQKRIRNKMLERSLNSSNNRRSSSNSVSPSSRTSWSSVASSSTSRGTFDFSQYNKNPAAKESDV